MLCFGNCKLLKNNELGSVRSLAAFSLELKWSWPLAPVEQALGLYTVASLVACTQEELNKYLLNISIGGFFFINSKLISKSKCHTLFHNGKLSLQQVFFTNHLDHNQMDVIIIRSSKYNFLWPVLSTSLMSY